MERRSFLAMVPAFVGMLPFWRLVRRRKPVPRWEWTRWEWSDEWPEADGRGLKQRLQTRLWSANVTLFLDEWKRIQEHMRSRNAQQFLGSRIGHLEITGIYSASADNGCVECTVLLLESTADVGVVHVWPKQGTSRRHIIFPRINFYDLLQGEHAVVET